MPDIEYRRLEPITVYAASGVDPGGENPPAVIDRILPPQLDALASSGVDYREPGVFWYEPIEGTEDQRIWVSWLAGAAPVENDAWQVVELPAVERCAITVYRGEMAGIRDAWHAFMQAVAADGASFAGPCREVYLQADGPQSTWVTELQVPVA